MPEARQRPRWYPRPTSPPSSTSLRKHYRRELDKGAIKATAKVAENLYRRATGAGREALVAAIFRLKTRAGWKEASLHEVSGPTRIELSWTHAKH